MTLSINLNKNDLNSQPAKTKGSNNSIFSKLTPIGKSGIHIKKKNEGKFTEYCGGKVTDAKIQQAKHSSNPTIRKRAVFAENARKWAHKHQAGGVSAPMFATYNKLTIPEYTNDYDDEDTEYNLSDLLTTKDNSDVFSPINFVESSGADTTPLLDLGYTPQLQTPQITIQTPQITARTTPQLQTPQITYSTLKGKQLFNAVYDKAEKSNANLSQYRGLLTKLAEIESNFDHFVQNKQGAPAYGYFQFMQDGKKYNNITYYANTDLNTFRNNPELQIQAAYKLLKDFEKSFTAADLKKAEDLGYSRDSLLAGAWLGGVNGVRKVLNNQGNPSDRFWSKKGYGSSVKEYMDKFK